MMIASSRVVWAPSIFNNIVLDRNIRQERIGLENGTTLSFDFFVNHGAWSGSDAKCKFLWLVFQCCLSAPLEFVRRAHPFEILDLFINRFAPNEGLATSENTGV